MKIYDTFTFFNELDLLEIRLNVLDPYVDKFVLCEANETFSGKPKPLYYEQHKERFAKWNHKIIHLVPENKETNDPFERAAYQKDFIRNNLSLNNEDIIYFGDLDEIWQPITYCDDKVYNLQQLNYSYYLNQRSDESWVGTVVGKWQTFKHQSVNYWRANHSFELKSGGWHFTNCMNYDNLLVKIASYDHCLEADIPWVRENLKLRIERGEDYLGRETDWRGKPFRMWIDDSQLPKFILDNKEKWIEKGLWKS